MSTVKAINFQHPSSSNVNMTFGTDGSVSGGLPFPNRNLVYNGAMQIAQRATSVSGITGGNYYTADRWTTFLTTAGTWTNSIEADGPSGSGFTKSMKWLCTTANASLSAGSAQIPTQAFEGQDLQRLAYGSSSAQQLTLSFWVKSNVTGTYIAELTATRSVSATYTITASGTWEKKTITFPANTLDVIANDNTGAMTLRFWLAAGSTFSGGSTLQTSWGSTANARAVGQTNLAAAINNYWQVTGVQLEIGPAPTAFEFKPFAQEVRECYRYFERISVTGQSGIDRATGLCTSTTSAVIRVDSIVPKRSIPTSSSLSAASTFSLINSGGGVSSISAISIVNYSSNGLVLSISGASGLVAGGATIMYGATGQTCIIDISAEL